MKVVLDTNVLYAVFTVPNGFCAELFRLLLARHEVVVSEHILVELSGHLIGKAKLSPQKVDAVIDGLRHFTTVVVPGYVARGACRDADDLPVLGTALSAEAKAIITGDKDLLVLVQFGDALILTPRAFYDRFFSHA